MYLRTQNIIIVELIDIIEILVFALIIAILVVMRLNQRNAELRQKAQMNMLFTSLTHELLTPLTVLSASIENLREVEPKYKSQYALMEINIQRSVRLLQQILETTKAKDGRLRLLVSHGDVMAYIRNTARTIIPLMAKNNLAFSIKCQPESMMGWIDTDKLDKIIFNLLSNAAKYTTGENGRVELTVKTNDRYDRVIISVKDNGCGIPEDKLSKIFEPYYTTKASGTGLGLTLVYKIMKEHNGDIHVKSELGKGTEFILDFPVPVSERKALKGGEE